MNSSAENINSLWSELIVEELIRHGINYFCISPGSRSTPLTTAIARHAQAQKIIIYDERSAAFHALGYARARGKPAVLICTSGTAPANYLPAVIEARQENVPLIVLSADRPPELRDSGANQTVDQIGLFGSYVNWFFDMPAPDANLSPAFVLDRVDRLVDKALGHPPGPVHLNCMFREPLAPEKQTLPSRYLNPITHWLRSRKAFTSVTRSRLISEPDRLDFLLETLNRTRNGLLIAGELPPWADKISLWRCLQKLQWPVFADITSGLRLGFDWPGFVPHFDLLLAGDAPRFDTVIHMGGRFVSKRLWQYLQTHPPQVHVQIASGDQWINPSKTVTHRIGIDLGEFCALAERNTDNSTQGKSLIKRLRRQSDVIAALVEEQFDRETLTQPGIARTIAREMPEGHGLFLANSLSVREMDMFAVRPKKPVFVAANRGASGIDGNISSAAGFAVGLQKPVTLLIGDLAFLHDLNALGVLRRIRQPLVVVLINNGGGGIFHWLPIAQFDDVFENYFATPHSFHFRHAAHQFDVQYRQPLSLPEFVQAYRQALASGQPALIEIKTDRTLNAKQYFELLKAIKEKTEPLA